MSTFAGLFGYVHGDRVTAINWFGAVLIMVAIVAVEVFPRLCLHDHSPGLRTRN
jgi:hypothetical protein